MQSGNHMRRFLWLLSLILGIALVDQLVKRWMVELIGPSASQHRIELLGSFVALEYLQNTGAAFGMFRDATTLFAIVAVVAIGVGLFLVWREAASDWPLALGISLIIGGALGNVIDRIVRGYVVDFVAIGRFWKFNLADSCITLGVLFVFWLLWRADNQESDT